MKKTMVALALAALAGVPAVAMQQPAQTKQAGPAMPRTVAGRLTLFEMANYAGDNMEIDQPRTTVHTDWPIRSITVHPGDRWQICARPRFQAPCIVLNRSLSDASVVGIEGQIGSARQAPEMPAAAPAGN